MTEKGKGNSSNRKKATVRKPATAKKLVTAKKTATRKTSNRKKTTSPKRATTKKTRQSSTKAKNIKAERKIYFKVGLGIFSTCVILLLISFFCIPVLNSKLNPKFQKIQQEKNTVIQNTQKPKSTQIIEKPKQKTAKKVNKKAIEKQPIVTKPKTVTVNEKSVPTKSEPITKKEITKQPTAKPKPKANKPVAKPKKDIPPVPHKGSIILVVDDAGHNLSQLQAFLDLPFKCTIAVLPGRAHSVEAACRIRKAGKEVILHQPMQATNPNVDPGYGAIKPVMTKEEVIKTLKANIDEIWPIAGMNNHEGSLITENKTFMKIVLEVAREKGIYFLDSRTTAKTVVPNVAKEMNMVIWERAVFLDNIKEKKVMKAQIEHGLEIAEKDGYAIMIGHVFTTELADLLTEMYPDLKAAGFSLSTISEVASGKTKGF